jgi:hypothetical protein
MNEDDITSDTIDVLKRMLYYAQLAEERGDQAHMESTTFEKKVVITIKRRKDKKV